ncbi:temperature associated repressor [Cylindrobasidium torrendii FP15055 ss-10]|uniref:Temperature associated repressor n=1 Tax=Cylindrobasidium torrendii FP15055 ss-10 TaxID=1314674 RepID=A0A0D7BAK3_9AGAR|nr:temperature associated repressor [Cylindrobasidium torrendii FP15055 ss-10]
MAKILIVGATGLQGGAVVDRLLAAREQADQPYSLSALTRDPNSKSAKALASSGIEVIQGGLEDTKALTSVLTSNKIERAFLVTTPYAGVGIKNEIQYGKNFVAAAKAAGLKHLVFASVEGSDQKTGVPHFDSKAPIEYALKESGVPYTILRPVVFMENFPAVGAGLQRALTLGMFSTVLGKKTIQLVAVQDVGYFAVESLLKPEDFAGKEISIAGDEVTVAQLAEAYGKVHYNGRSKASVAWVPSIALNLMPDMTNKMFKFLAAHGFHVDIPKLKTEHPGLLSFEDWLRVRKESGKPDAVIRNH